MAANTSPIFVKNITAKGVTWTNADAASTKKVISPTIGTEGCRVNSIALTTDDTASNDYKIYLSDGTNDYLVGTVQATTLAGTNSSNASISVLAKVTLLPWVSSDGSLLVPTGWSLKMMNVTQVTSGKTVTVVVVAGDY